jgi:transcriptional regulator with XRE-family HTH domain
MMPKQVRAARALLGCSQADLAKEAGLGIRTIALAARGFLNELGKPYAAKSVASTCCVSSA